MDAKNSNYNPVSGRGKKIPYMTIEKNCKTMSRTIMLMVGYIQTFQLLLRDTYIYDVTLIYCSETCLCSYFFIFTNCPYKTILVTLQ